MKIRNGVCLESVLTSAGLTSNAGATSWSPSRRAPAVNHAVVFYLESERRFRAGIPFELTLSKLANAGGAISVFGGDPFRQISPVRLVAV